MLLPLLFLQIAFLTAAEAVDLSADEVAEIRAQCSENLKRGGSEAFDRCIQQKGSALISQKMAESMAKAAALGTPAEPGREPLICRKEQALQQCQSALKKAAVGNTPAAKDHQVQSVLMECRSACNPQSAENLQFLSACGSSADVEKRKMASRMDSCGYAVAEASPTPEKPTAEKSWTDSIWETAEAAKVEVQKVALRIGGMAESAKSSGFGSFAQEHSVQIEGDVDYVRIEDRSGKRTYMYRSRVDNSLHESLEEANLRNQNKIRETVSDMGFKGSDGSGKSPTAESHFASDQYGYESESEAAPADQRLSFPDQLSSSALSDLELSMGQPAPAKRPAARPQVSPPTTSPAATVAAGSPRAPDQPLSQQAVVPGAYLQNALNAPVGQASLGSGHEISSGGGLQMASGLSEVRRSGFGSSSGGASGRGGTVAFNGLSNAALERPAVETPSRGEALEPVVAPMAGVAAAGAGSPSAGFAPLGRMMASRRSPKDREEPLFRSESFRSDSFYRSGGSKAPAPSRWVQTNPKCKPTKTNPCARTRVALKPSENQGCDGNPECILRLTGKIKMAKAGIAGDRDLSLDRQRGVASLQKKSEPQKLPDGVWRGYIDVLAHMNTLGASYLKLDHEGFLAVEEAH